MTANLNCKLYLNEIINELVNCELKYSPFNRIIKRLRHPICTVFIYSTGKIVSLGSKSVLDAKKSIRIVSRLIQKCGYDVRLSSVVVNNIAATMDLKSKFVLNEIDNQIGKASKFNKEIFPNLRFTSPENKRHKLNLARNGKVIMTGAKEIKDFTEMFTAFLKAIKYNVSENVFQCLTCIESLE